ncbi:MAG TPA: hypothetical protein VFV98_05495 [Vicinamibacterales bacterium]|nr:hypothetical protein [Vicinamibacterales bacterium]
MADTNAHHADQIPVEGDGVSYSGIVWFVVILTVTTLFCQLLVWGLFEYMQSREFARDPARSAVAAPTGTLPPTPNLLTDEPANLKHFRDAETTALETYGWVDQNAGTVRLPIEKAKELILERGLPVRSASAPSSPDAAADKGAKKAGK